MHWKQRAPGRSDLVEQDRGGDRPATPDTRDTQTHGESAPAAYRKPAQWVRIRTQTRRKAVERPLHQGQLGEDRTRERARSKGKRAAEPTHRRRRETGEAERRQQDAPRRERPRERGRPEENARPAPIVSEGDKTPATAHQRRVPPSGPASQREEGRKKTQRCPIRGTALDNRQRGKGPPDPSLSPKAELRTKRSREVASAKP